MHAFGINSASRSHGCNKQESNLPVDSLSSDWELYGLLAGLHGELDWFSIECCDFSNVSCPGTKQLVTARKRGELFEAYLGYHCWKCPGSKSPNWHCHIMAPSKEWVARN